VPWFWDVPESGKNICFQLFSRQGPDELGFAQSCQRKYKTNRYPNKEDSLAAVLDWCYNLWNSRNPKNKFKPSLGCLSEPNVSQLFTEEILVFWKTMCLQFCQQIQYITKAFNGRT
jgi:hypothetical protein